MYARYFQVQTVVTYNLRVKPVGGQSQFNWLIKKQENRYSFVVGEEMSQY